MVHYTGHPLIDVGLATMAAFAQKRRPEDLKAEDLEQIARYIETNYVIPPLRGHMTMAFTSNAWFIQDAYNPDKPGLSADERAARQATRRAWADRHLRQCTAPGHSELCCVFTGLPAVSVPLSNKLPEGRAGRAQMPLLQGDDAINFFTDGQPGLPISGIALLALQFMPMGCAKAGIGLLAVHADDDRITYELAWSFLEQNRRAVALAQQAGEDKLPSATRSLKTLLVEALIAADQRRASVERRRERGISISAYNFNNGKSSRLAIYHLPLEITDFILAAQSLHADAWQRLVQRGWQQPAAKKKTADSTEPRKNYVYEDLFELLHGPDQIRQFIRTYFLRIPRRTPFADDPRRAYTLRGEANLISWPLVELFLAKVGHMDAERIARICALGDGLAIYVKQTGGKKFFRNFFTEHRPALFRALLIKANIAHIKAGNEPLFDVLTYATIFEEGDEIMRRDWRLARDLVLMRMIDQLRPWLTDHPDAVPEEVDEEEVNETVSA